VPLPVSAAGSLATKRAGPLGVVIFDHVSATVELHRDTLARRRIAAPNGVPVLPEAFAFNGLWLSWMRAARLDSATVTADHVVRPSPFVARSAHFVARSLNILPSRGSVPTTPSHLSPERCV